MGDWNAHHGFGKKIGMFLEEPMQLPFPRLGIVQQLLEQTCFVVSSIHFAPNGHKAAKPPSVFPSEIKFALVGVFLAKRSSDTIESAINGYNEPDPLVVSHRT